MPCDCPAAKRSAKRPLVAADEQALDVSSRDKCSRSGQDLAYHAAIPQQACAARLYIDRTVGLDCGSRQIFE